MSARETARELAQEKAAEKWNGVYSDGATDGRELDRVPLTGSTTVNSPQLVAEAARQHNAVNVAILRGAISEAGQDAIQGMNLNELENLCDAREKLERWITDAAAAARAAGYSWTDVGNALGVTKQAAQQRYGKPTY